MQHDIWQFSVMDFHTHNSFMPCHVPSTEVNSAIQKYCQRGPSFANGDQELFTKTLSCKKILLTSMQHALESQIHST